jgi:hypothetical protein
VILWILWLFFTCIFHLNWSNWLLNVFGKSSAKNLAAIWQPKSPKKADFDLWRPQIFFLVRLFWSLKVHRQTITVFVSFTLVKIESFGWLNWQKHLLLSVVTVFLLWTYNVFLFIHKNWIEFYLNCSFI